MWAYRLALSLGEPLRLHERVAIGEETDPDLRQLVAERYFQQGRALQARGRLDEALMVLQRGSFIYPEHAALHSAVGAIFLRLGRDLEAVSWLERAVELDPGQTEWRVLLSQAFEGSGRPGEALLHYRRALRLDPALGSAQDAVRRLEQIVQQRARAAGPQPWWLARSNPQ